MFIFTSVISYMLLMSLFTSFSDFIFFLLCYLPFFRDPLDYIFLIVNSLPFVLLCISCESTSFCFWGIKAVGFSRFYRFHSFSSLAFWSLQTMYFTNKKMLKLIYFILLYSGIPSHRVYIIYIITIFLL